MKNSKKSPLAHMGEFYLKSCPALSRVPPLIYDLGEREVWS